ncbi:hypothetical protein ACW2AB_11395 [Limosilactobacillus fermentum]
MGGSRRQNEHPHYICVYDALVGSFWPGRAADQRRSCDWLGLSRAH